MKVLEDITIRVVRKEVQSKLVTYILHCTCTRGDRREVEYCSEWEADPLGVEDRIRQTLGWFTREHEPAPDSWKGHLNRDAKNFILQDLRAERVDKMWGRV